MNSRLPFKIAFFFLVCPAVVWMLLAPGRVFQEWLKFPLYAKQNLSATFSPDRLLKVNEVRWDAFGGERENLPSKVFYNKGYVLADSFASYLAYFSPRFYFQAGDGGNFTNPKAEPVAMPLFFFWILGIVYLIKNRKFKKIVGVLIFGLIAYVAGKRNFAYLLPVALLYISIGAIGIENFFSKKAGKFIYFVLILYGGFLIARMFLI